MAYYPQLSVQQRPRGCLILGTAPLGGLGLVDIPFTAALTTIEAAINSGFGCIDTAPLYGFGRAELYVGEAVRNSKNPHAAAIELSTKVGRVIRRRADVAVFESAAWSHTHYPDGGITTGMVSCDDYTYNGVMVSFQQSFERLQYRRISHLRLHDAETEEKFHAAVNNGAVDALIDLKKQGRIGGISLGMNNASFILAFLKRYPNVFDSVMMAGNWNLIHQDGAEVLVECEKQNVAVHNVGIFASGLLWGGSTVRYVSASEEDMKKRDMWMQLCGKHKISLPGLSIAFACLPSVVSHISFGCKSATEVEANVSLFDEYAKLTPAALSALMEGQSLGLLPKDLPLKQLSSSVKTSSL